MVIKMKTEVEFCIKINKTIFLKGMDWR